MKKEGLYYEQYRIGADGNHRQGKSGNVRAEEKSWKIWITQHMREVEFPIARERTKLRVVSQYKTHAVSRKEAEPTLGFISESFL